LASRNPDRQEVNRLLNRNAQRQAVGPVAKEKCQQTLGGQAVN